jgi:hypothetical protein
MKVVLQAAETMNRLWVYIQVTCKESNLILKKLLRLTSTLKLGSRNNLSKSTIKVHGMKATQLKARHIMQLIKEEHLSAIFIQLLIKTVTVKFSSTMPA